MVRPTYPGVPLPIGYVEMQSSWFEDERTDEQHVEYVRDLIAKTTREQPHLKHYSTRAEFITDGGGRRRVNLYLGFEPKIKAAEPLDPRNLNDAPLPQPGAIEPTDGITPLGYRETQFGRGT